MLTLSRKPGEEIVILGRSGEQITLKFTKHRGKIVCHFDAPIDVRILRGELLERAKEVAA